MSVITISTDKLESKDILALKAFLKALKISFEEYSNKSKSISIYDPDFVEKIKESQKEFEEGNYTSIQTEDLWK